jgi:hypothetical protein
MGRRPKPDRQRHIPVAVSIHNWEFLKQNTTRGRKLDDFISILISEKQSNNQTKEDIEYWKSQAEDAWKSCGQYRQTIGKLKHKITELENRLSLTIDGNLIEPKIDTEVKRPVPLVIRNNLPILELKKEVK